MNREEFTEKIKTANDVYDKTYCENVITDSLKSLPDHLNNKGTLNLIIVMEELSELQQELSKFIRGKNGLMDITEELADVYLGMKYVQSICGISDETLIKAFNVKIERQDKRNTEEGNKNET